VDRFDNMRVFAKVVESGSFAGAAARLGISASMVTLHVKELEERLGVRLLNRTTRKVSLTETGRAYYERCTRLLADLEETEQAVSDMHAAPRGELRVNAAPTFGILQLAPAIADFTARFPAISVELMLSVRVADLVDEGFDVAVWVGELPDSSLIARQLAPCRMVVCGAPSYFEKHGKPRTPADLTAHNCLTVAGTALSYYRAWHLTAADGTALNISPMGNLRTNSGAVLKVAALAGHGLVYLPTYFVGDALQSGRLVTALDDYMARRYRCATYIPTIGIYRPRYAPSSTFSRHALGRSLHGTAGAELPASSPALPSPHQTEMTRSPTKPRRSKTRLDAR
jgi:DNA-binding transcriptional LysR family regulator